MKGYLNSIAAENGIFTVTVQGCTLRCVYCDRPTCWEKEKAPLQLSAQELFEKITASGAGQLLVTGGEPLEQAEFLTGLFAQCRRAGIQTVLDTPGSRVNPDVEALLDQTDRVQLHLKDSTEEGYRKIVQYPFGYGLSYTTFSWELVEAPTAALTDSTTVHTVKVKVTNTGINGSRCCNLCKRNVNVHVITLDNCSAIQIFIPSGRNLKTESV